jgi:hypothetical protein
MVIFFIIVSYCTFSQSSVIEHKVSPGETLYRISLMYDISVDDIKEFNGLIDDIIYIDQIINIPCYINDTDIYQNETFERDCLQNIYYSQIGIRERTGNNDGVDVEKYLAASGLGKGYPWCAAFVNWVFLECGHDLNLQYPAWVPSYFPSDRLIYVKGQFSLRNPVRGDLIGIWFENKGRLAHIGFYDEKESEYITITVEGNTNDKGSREGDGVYRKRRLTRQIHSISSWVEK